MSDDVEVRLRWLGDLEELRRIPQRYARAVDGGDIDAVGALLHPEARVEGTLGDLAAADYLAGLRKAGGRFTASMHLLADPLIDLEPGADRGSLDTYAVVHQVGPVSGEGDDVTLGMRYLDDVARTDDGWRIILRRTVAVWRR